MSKSVNRAVAFAVLACACVCMLAACDDAPTESAQAKPASEKQRLPATAEVAKDMVAAVSAGKASSAISVHFALRAPPMANTGLPVDIAIVPHRDFFSVRAHFESHDGLSTTSGEEFGPVSKVGSEKALTHQLVLLPSKEGMFMVTASVETDGDEGNVTRVFSIPVIVAVAPAPGPEPAPAATAAETPASTPDSN